MMKMYTSSDQTAKLIELGFEKPKHTFTFKLIELNDVKMDIDIPVSNYSIGELIEMLPRCIECGDGGDEAVLEISYDFQDFEWYCGHRWMYNRGWRCFKEVHKTCDDKELIDALYRYVVALKEEGVI